MSFSRISEATLDSLTQSARNLGYVNPRIFQSLFRVFWSSQELGSLNSHFSHDGLKWKGNFSSSGCSTIFLMIFWQTSLLAGMRLILGFFPSISSATSLTVLIEYLDIGATISFLSKFTSNFQKAGCGSSSCSLHYRQSLTSTICEYFSSHRIMFLEHGHDKTTTFFT